MDQDLYPAQCVLISLDSQYLEVSRLVGVDPDVTVGELALIAHAALGLEPAPPGHVHVGERLIEILDVLDEPAFHTLMNRSTGVDYHPSVGDWDIHLMFLSETRLQQATPALIDATGPDLVTAVGDGNRMRSMLEDVRQLLAGIPIPQTQWEAIQSIFPNYSLDQLRQRLTECFHPTIADRLRELSSVEDVMPEGLDFDTPFTPRMPARLEDPIGLREILLDSFPELQLDFPLPQLSDAAARTLGARLTGILRTLTSELRLTSTGAFRPALVKRLIEELDVEAFWPGAATASRESSVPPIGILHDFLVSMDYIEETSSRMNLAEETNRLFGDPGLVGEDYFTMLPFCDDDSDLVSTALLFCLLIRGEPLPLSGVPTKVGPEGPDNVHRTIRLYQMLGILAPDDPLRLTEAGRGMVGWQLHNLRGIIEYKGLLNEEAGIAHLLDTRPTPSTEPTHHDLDMDTLRDFFNLDEENYGLPDDFDDDQTRPF